MDTFENDFFTDMKDKDVEFFKRLGQRIAQLRKEQGLTQTELADLLNIKQQVVASYEVGRRRTPVSMLPAVAKALGTTAEDLIGEQPATGKRGPTPKLQRQVEKITRLPRSKQRFVSELLETVLQQAAAH